MINKQTGLMMFINGFPATLSPDELKSFLQRTIADTKKKGGCGNGSVASCRIVRITNPGTQEVERFALVELKPARFSLCCIKELRGKELAGVKINARRYRLRSILWERRQYRQESGEVCERRSLERRREGLRIEAVEFTTPRFLARLIGAFLSQPIGAYAE